MLKQDFVLFFLQLENDTCKEPPNHPNWIIQIILFLEASNNYIYIFGGKLIRIFKWPFA